MTSGQSGVICCWAFSIDPEEASRVTKVNDITNSPEKIESYDKICLSEYCWGNVSLVFTVDDTLPDKTLRLIYDSDPGWDDDTNVFVPYADSVLYLGGPTISPEYLGGLPKLFPPS